MASARTPLRRPAAAPALRSLRRELRRLADRRRAAVLRRFFKTGPGEYAAGDRFLGIPVPRLRRLTQRYTGLSRAALRALLASALHEERCAALLILTRQYEAGAPRTRSALFAFCLRHARRINNWDLVDLAAPQIIGRHLVDRSRAPLRRLARSPCLWERRIAIVATLAFIRRGDIAETLRLAPRLLDDPEELIHKALGWMLREVGKRDRAALEAFLRKHAERLPRVTLRYAIERFPRRDRRRWLRPSA